MLLGTQENRVSAQLHPSRSELSQKVCVLTVMGKKLVSRSNTFTVCLSLKCVADLRFKSI